MLAHGFRNPARLAIRPGHQRRLGRRPRRRVLGGARPRARADRPGAQLRLALLRGRPRRGRRPVRARAPAQRRPGPEHLREPLRGGHRDVRALLGLRPRASASCRARTAQTDPGTGEPAGTRSRASTSIRPGGSFPAAYHGALFFADRLRDCIWAMLPGPDGLPERGRVIPFAQARRAGVDIEVAPGGDLLYVDQAAEAVQRIALDRQLVQPAADRGRAGRHGHGRTGPLTVDFGAAGTSDPDPGDLLIYEWDLDGDGEFDDSTEAAPSHTFLQGGTFVVHAAGHRHLRAPSTPTRSRSPSAAGPSARSTPRAGHHVGGRRRRSRSRARPPTRGRRRCPPRHSTGASSLVHCTRPATAMSTSSRTCRTPPPVRSPRPTTRYPAYIEIRLTATDSDGETEHEDAAARPAHRTLNLNSSPPGLPLSRRRRERRHAAIAAGDRRLTRTRSQRPPQVDARQHDVAFSSWSDGQAQTHSIRAVRERLSYTARFTPFAPGPVDADFSPAAGRTRRGGDSRTRTSAPRRSCAPTTAAGRRREATCASSSAASGQGHEREAAAALGDRHRRRARRCADIGTGGPRPASTGRTGPPRRPACSPTRVRSRRGAWTEYDVTPPVAADGTCQLPPRRHLDRRRLDFDSREASKSREPAGAGRHGRERRLRAAEGRDADRFSLVPAYHECTAPEPGPRPAARAARRAARPRRSRRPLTVGSPDANGLPASSRVRAPRRGDRQSRHARGRGRRVARFQAVRRPRQRRPCSTTAASCSSGRRCASPTAGARPAATATSRTSRCR